MLKELIHSWWLLLSLETDLRRGAFASVHRRIQRSAVKKRPSSATAIADLCHRMDVACVFYPKAVLCLQRSAATTILLRRNGWRAELVLGVQIVPFQSHAWVEVDGAVVNDKPYVREIFEVMERCA